MEMDTLPPEVLERIFLSPELGARDLCSLCQTCRAFRNIIDIDNSLWRTKFQERWPQIYQRITAAGLADPTETQWSSVYCQRELVKRIVVRRLKEIARASGRAFQEYQKAQDEAFVYNFCQLLSEDVRKDLCLLFVNDELLQILHRGNSGENLTVKYYAEKALWYIHHQNWLPVLMKFFATSADEQDIELGATLIAQWLQPQEYFTVADVKSELDALANSAKDVLKTMNPEHPLFSHEVDIVPEKLHQSLWRPGPCKQILQALEVIVKPTFNKGFSAYYIPANSYINLVLKNKQGIPISMSLTVMCIAKRLGLVLEPVNFPQHFLLRWMEFPSKSGINRYTFVDVFNGSYSKKYDEIGAELLPHHTPIVESQFDRCTDQEVLRRILRNLLNLARQQHSDSKLEFLRHAIGLFSMFVPDDLELVILFTQVSLHLKVSIAEASKRIDQLKSVRNFSDNPLLKELQDQCQGLLNQLRCSQEEEPKKDLEVKRRAQFPEVQYSVGMVMRHRKYDYLCVIRGWDAECMATERWMAQMGVHRCQRGRKQPFYMVWVWDSSERYAAEENLAFTKDAELIDHPEVGRLFERFTGRYYEPGAELMAEYPDDLEVTHTKVAEFFKADHS